MVQTRLTVAQSQQLSQATSLGCEAADKWLVDVIERQRHMVSAVDDEQESDAELDVLLAEPAVKRPPMYAVVLLNDNYTPMEFVVHILVKYFKHSAERATEIMLNVHYKGKGVAGVYPRDIAETKAQQVNTEARLEGHPLLCQIEPQE